MVNQRSCNARRVFTIGLPIRSNVRPLLAIATLTLPRPLSLELSFPQWLVYARSASREPLRRSLRCAVPTYQCQCMRDIIYSPSQYLYPYFLLLSNLGFSCTRTGLRRRRFLRTRDGRVFFSPTNIKLRFKKQRELYA